MVVFNDLMKFFSVSISNSVQSVITFSVNNAKLIEISVQKISNYLKIEKDFKFNFDRIADTITKF